MWHPGGFGATSSKLRCTEKKVSEISKLDLALAEPVCILLCLLICRANQATAHKDVAHLLQNFENVPERVICVDFYQFTRSVAEFYC